MAILFYIFKFFGWLINLLVVILGGIILSAGIYATIETSAFSSQISLSSIITQPAIMFIVLGSLLVIIGIMGVVGTLREVRFILWIYAAIVGIILTLEIALVAYLVYSFTQNKEQLQAQAETAFTPLIENYRDDNDLRALIDLLQNGLSCCGINSFHDWENNRYFNCSAPGVEKCGVPNSCCKDELQLNSQCGYDVRSLSSNRLDNIKLISCLQAFDLFLTSNQITLGVIGAVLLLIQVSAIVLSLMLSFEIPNKREDDVIKKLRANRPKHRKSHPHVRR
ncbi:hypothetical protein LOD99_4427 [Oopsacas minuta]|uniref:Tetraspanin n=1 Tax=Oopsacas minuta TaxID=111878 RepID=A0AAV7JV05_9METZ|nr:hypothetical protein LOD99_4427 [Oopsacas minuta]